MLEDYKVAILTSAAGLSVFQRQDLVQLCRLLGDNTRNSILLIPSFYPSSPNKQVDPSLLQREGPDLKVHTHGFHKKSRPSAIVAWLLGQGCDQFVAYPNRRDSVVTCRVWSVVSELDNLGKHVSIVLPWRSQT